MLQIRIYFRHQEGGPAGSLQPARGGLEQAASLAAACREIATAERRPSGPEGPQDDVHSLDPSG
jgi:hypothetical protein